MIRFKMTKINYWSLLLLLLLFSITLKAQVTIGSDHVPNQGTILDLKSEENGSSTKGLLLPRVNLTKRLTLEDIASGVADTQRLEHTGLTVYNVNPNAPFCPGVFLWNSASWIRLGAECPPYLTGLSDIDFGTSSATKAITFKTNQSWSYTTESKYTSVIGSAASLPNTTHPGGDLAAIGEGNISFNISPTLTPNDPANTKYETKLHFKTEDHPDGKCEEKTITAKRTVPSRWENAAIPTSVARTGGNITFSINTNDIWRIDGPNNSAAFPAESFRTRSLTFYISPNNDWQDKVHTVYTRRYNSVTGGSTQVNHNVTQGGYYFYPVSNSGVPVPIPAGGGTFFIEVRGNGNICPVIIYNTSGSETAPQWQLNRKIALPENGSTVRLYFDVSSNFGALFARTVRVYIGRFYQDGVTQAGYAGSIADVAQGNIFRQANEEESSEENTEENEK